MIKPEIQELLQKNNRPRNWQELENKMKPVPVSKINGQTIYQFFDVLDDTLQVSSDVISISVQPVASYVPLHMHDYIEITIPLKGDCTMVTVNERLHLEQDDLVIMGNQTVHTVEDIPAGKMVASIALRQTAFSLSDLDRIRSRSGISSMLFSLIDEQASRGGYSLFKINHNLEIVMFIEDIINEYYSPDEQSNQLIRLDLLQIFTRLTRLIAKNQSASLTNGGSKNETDFLSILLYIEKHYATVTLNELAKQFGFNPNYLSEILKKRTGLTFIKLVKLKRMNVATHYLTYTDTAIDKVALAVGYENPSYFYKVFRASLGMSPRDYRLQNQKEKE